MKGKHLRTVTTLSAAAFFAAGWTLAGRRTEAAGETSRSGEGAPLPAGGPGTPDKVGTFLQDEGGNMLRTATGRFDDLLKMDAAAARMRTGDWLALWRELAPMKRHDRLMENWPEADPHGALKAALTAQADTSLSSQERFDFHHVGSRALNELFSRDPAAAAQGMKDWRSVCGEYPRLDCLHLLVTGTSGQKETLLQFLRQDGAVRVPIGQVADGLKVLEVLTRTGFSSRSDIMGGVVHETMSTDPEAAVDWVLKQRAAGGSVSPWLMERAVSGLMSAERLKPDLKSTEAAERLLDAAPADVVDEWAPVYAERKAWFDMEGARLWARTHVPEARLKFVLMRLDMLAKKPRRE